MPHQCFPPPWVPLVQRTLGINATFVSQSPSLEIYRDISKSEFDFPYHFKLGSGMLVPNPFCLVECWGLLSVPIDDIKLTSILL